MSDPVMTPKVDRITGSALILDHAEHDIHEGNSFTFHFEGATPTNIGDETAIAFVTPVRPAGELAPLVHLIVDVVANDESVFEIRENPTIVLNQGTTATPINRDRNSDNTSGMLDRETALINAISTFNVVEANNANLELGSGVLLHSETIAVGGNPPFGGLSNGASRASREFILKFETVYAIIMTSSTVNTTTHHITLNWSEDIPSDFAN